MIVLLDNVLTKIILQVVVVFASLSLFALTFVCLRVTWLLARPLFNRNNHRTRSNEHAFFNTQLGHYAACLLTSSVFTSIAGLIVGTWIARGGVQEGKFASVCLIII
jgi:hypothetical protein